MSNNFIQKATGASPSGLTDSLVFDNGSNVGIGTTTPQWPLHVYASSVVDVGLVCGVDVAANTDGLNVGHAGSSFGSGQSFLNAHSVTAGNGKLRIMVNGDTKIIVQNDGKVGIGTTSPGQVLDVNGAAALGTLVPHSGSLVLDSNGSSNSIQFKINGTEKIQITTAGVLLLDAGQVQFPATQNPSSDANTLDDYEEGTWTPVLGGADGESNQAYLYQSGKYTKIGRLINASLYLQFNQNSTGKGTISGYLRVKGLPFATGGGSSFHAATVGTITNMGTNHYISIFAYTEAAATVMQIRGAKDLSDHNAFELVAADVNDATQLIMSVTYSET